VLGTTQTEPTYAEGSSQPARCQAGMGGDGLLGAGQVAAYAGGGFQEEVGMRVAMVADFVSGGGHVAGGTSGRRSRWLRT
jgi:hypothetical protein